MFCDPTVKLGEIDREGKIVENASFLTAEEKENILANNVFEFVGRKRCDFVSNWEDQAFYTIPDNPVYRILRIFWRKV